MQAGCTPWAFGRPARLLQSIQWKLGPTGANVGPVDGITELEGGCSLFRNTARILSLSGLAVLLATVTPASAQDSEAKAAFKAMSDFLTQQATLSVSYDATLEIVTEDLEKVGLASSGALNATRPDKLRATRSGGLANVELVFDGAEMSVYGKNLNVFAKQAFQGTIDELVDALRLEFGLQLPAADLLSANPHDIMMLNVTDAQALGTGVIRGQTCDHLAFRTDDVDWQVWIAQGDKPFPCRFTITSKMTVMAPSYDITFSDWKSGAEVAKDDYKLVTAAGATEVDISKLGSLDEVQMPKTEGAAQ